KTLLKQETTLEPARTLAICGQVAAALDAAHARGLVHRDVKPSNVLLDENEHVYLADFGLSRQSTEAGEDDELSVGTPAYVAPEQIEGDSVDGRADQYALGCLLYECLTGSAPFERDSDLAVLWAHVQEPPPPLSEHNTALPADIDAVVAKAMAKSPDDRYENCGAFLDAAHDALGVRQRTAGWKTWWLVPVVVGVAMIAAAGTAGVLLSRGGGSHRPNSAPTLT